MPQNNDIAEAAPDKKYSIAQSVAILLKKYIKLFCPFHFSIYCNKRDKGAKKTKHKPFHLFTTFQKNKPYKAYSTCKAYLI